MRRWFEELTQDLGYALNFLFTTYYRIEFIVFCKFGEIATEIIEHGCARFFSALLFFC